MKDDRLEKEFEEYFKGVNIPDDITADAKANVVPKRRIMPNFVKFASIAASIVLVFAVTLTVIFGANFNRVSPGDETSNSGPNGDVLDEADGNLPSGDPSGGADSNTPSGGSSGGADSNTPSGGSSGGADSNSPSGGSGSGWGGGEAEELPPSAPNPPGSIGGGSSGGSENDWDQSLPDNEAGDSPDGQRFVFYTDESLDFENVNADDLSSIHSSLQFIETCLDDGVTVENCKSAYMNENLAFIEAELTKDDGHVLESVQLFVEFTNNYLVYSELADYYEGDIYYYNQVGYYLTKTSDNGNTQSKLLIIYGGVKYYFSISSSNEDAYMDYLKLIVK